MPAERPVPAVRCCVFALCVSLPLFLAACGGAGSAEPGDPPSADTTPPELAISSPAAGAVVASPVTVVASATDDSGIAVVRFFGDDVLLGEVTNPPYEMVWQAAAGNRSVRVEAVDGSSAANTSSVSADYVVDSGSSGIPGAGQWEDEDFGTVYEVGPGRQYEEVSEVPWESVGAGTLVKIFWRSEPYRAKWVLNAAGTEDNPVVVTGVPQGAELPVISGQNAETRSQLAYQNQERSIIKVGGSDTPAGDLAEWIFIENLAIEGANPANQFTSSSGQTGQYASNAASVHVQLGRNIYLRNNVFRNSGNGLFSGFQSAQLVISGNRFEGNGNTGSASQHNSYTESLGIVYEYNWFRPLKSGATGNNLKDRSAGTVIRYNWIESGSRQLDLVDSDHSNIYNSGEYAATFVYGNVLIEPANSTNGNIVHYGGDLSGREATYRKGTLYFYHNTIISYRTDRAVLFGMSSNDEAADARNNLFFSPAGGDTLAITSGRGLIALEGNWLQSGWDPSSETLTGTVNDNGNTEGSTPQFVDEAALNFRLEESSSAVNAGVALATAVSGHPVTSQYDEHQDSVARQVVGAPDAGAFEFGGGSQSPVITTDTLADGEAGEPYSQFLHAQNGKPPFTWQVVSGDLPDGLVINSATGEISGTPTVESAQTFTVSVTDGEDQQASAVLSLTIVSAMPPGDSSIDDYSASSATQSLSFVNADLSGITYAPDSNTFFLIQNNGGRIWEVDVDFNRIRTITLSGAGDTEDIAYLGDNEFAIVDESSLLLIGTIAPAETSISAGDFQRIVFDSYSGNSGYEGVTYDPILRTFYVVKEKSPKRIRSFVRPLTSVDTTIAADVPFDADDLPASDLSAVTLDSRTGRLLILSDESHRLLDVGLDGFVHGQLQMADATQHEGVALDSSFNLYVTSEPNHYRVYSQ